MTPKLPSLIRQWFGKSAPQAAAKSSGFRPEVELLEMREVPAVTALLSGTTLTITGDVADDDITVSGAAGTYIITGNNGTSVNNGGPFSNVATIKIAMGSGNDVVNVQADTLTNLSIDGGTGANSASVSLNSVTSTLSLLNNDYNYVFAGSGDLTLKTVNVTGGGTGSGSGVSTYTQFATNPGGNLTITGAFKATHGASTDYLLIGAGSGYSAANVKLNSVTINNGDGGSQTVIGSQYYYGSGSGSAPTNITVTGALSITNGAGFDNNVIGTGSSYYGNGGNIKLNSVTINNGDGGSQTVIGSENGYVYGYASGSSSLTIAGAVNITNGVGSNSNVIGGGYYGGYYGQSRNVAVTSVTITNGAGSAENILGTFNGSMTATGAVKITNGDGEHDNVIYSVAYYYGSGSGFGSVAANLSLKDVTIVNGKGYSQNYIYAYNDYYYGSGSGSGFGSAGSMTISGNTTITNGDGYADNYVGGVGYYAQVPVTKVVGAVTISNGYGGGFTLLGNYYGYDLGSGGQQQFTGPITITAKGVGSGLGSGSGSGSGFSGQAFLLVGVAATKTVKVTLGDTDDYVDIESSSFAQPVSIATGGGNDYVSIGAAPVSSFSNAYGTSFNYPVGVLFAPPSLSVDLGAGDDVLILGSGSGGPGATFLGAMFNGGVGYDELYQYPNGTQSATLDQNFEYKTGSGTPPKPPEYFD
ncbi:MAG: hypothetical protein U0792_02640 [Gemmataceae bacterium]